MILLLVDVDNLLGDLSREALALDALALLPVGLTPLPAGQKVIAALALNLASAHRFQDWAELETFGTSLARRLAPQATSVTVEVALALIAPETADELLERLLMGSPTDNPEELTHVSLVTGDHGLRGRIAHLLEGLATSGGETRHWRWTLTTPVARTPPSPGVPHTAVKPSGFLPSETPPVTRLDREELCAVGWPVQGPTDWQELLEAIDRSPWLLSQLGGTLPLDEQTPGSVRGVARLRERLIGASPEQQRLVAHPGDGVEVGRGNLADVWEFHLPQVTITPSTVGAGAVRLRWSDGGQPRCLTVRSALPRRLLEQASREGLTLQAAARSPRLDDAALAASLQGKLPIVPTVKVRFRCDSAKLRAKIVAGHGAWWWHDRPGRDEVSTPRPQSVVSTTRLQCVHGLDGIDAGAAIGTGPVLRLQSPAPAGARIKLEETLVAGCIGRGVWQDDHGQQWHCAVLSGKRRSGLVTCDPIQEVSLARVVATLLPLGYSSLEAEAEAAQLVELPLLITRGQKKS